MDRLYERLNAYCSENYYPMHMPGHKRNMNMLPMDNPYGIDITEIEGFDNLHHARGIIRDLSNRIRELYGAYYSYPLVNGSTAGILAGISAATKRGDKILLARNSHKSVYHGIVLKELQPIYAYPQQIEDLAIPGGISPATIRDLLITHKNIKLVVITSPTYEGMVSDIAAIAEEVHRQGALLLVDEAHGAHLGFHKDFPESAVKLGADIVIQSLHKTLPAFTQTAMLHLNRKDLKDRIEKYLAIYQTSSPSYLLMAGIDRCISLLEDRGEELFEAYYKRLTDFRHSLLTMKHLKLVDLEVVGKYDIYRIDPTKITIAVKGTDLTGPGLHELLKQRAKMVMELDAPDYILGITGISDTEDGLERFRDGLLSIDKEVSSVHCIRKEEYPYMLMPEAVMTPGEAMEQKTTTVKLSDSDNRISGTFIALFPPGAPVLVPGERIRPELLRYIDKMKNSGFSLTGLSGEEEDEIEVIA